MPEYEDYFFDQWEHEDFGPYWQQPSLFGRGYHHDFPDVPSLHISSWYDPYISAAIENFHSLGRRGSRPVQLVLGPWTHGRRSDSHAGEVDMGGAAPLEGNLADDYVEFRTDWLDAVLADSTPPGAPVRWFLMGGGSGRRQDDGRLDHGGRWRDASTWPPESTRQRHWHLRADGGLSRDAETSPATVSWQHDPRDPVPTVGGQVTSGGPVMHGGAFDQRCREDAFAVRSSTLPLASRPDVLVFQTEPLDEPVVVAGPVRARLRVASSAVDTDLTIKVIDVHPPTPDDPAGFAMNLTEGILRLRYRDGFENPRALEPNRAYDVVVEAPDTANLFSVGHRLRVDISSSNFPRFDVNPGTGGRVAGERRQIVATNTIHLAASHVELWVESTPEATDER